MRLLAPLAITVACALVPASAQAPTCQMCPASYIPVEEIEQYLTRAKGQSVSDQQVRAVNVGKSHVAVGLVHRAKLAAPTPGSVAEHDLVSEVYHIISGRGTLMTGPDLIGLRRRPADNEAVRLLNGPSNNAESIRNGVSHELKAGDVMVIPAGTGHQWTKIDEPITYLMIRVDPDKATPIKDEEASKADLSRVPVRR